MTELEKALATVKILDKKKAVDLKAIHITDYSIVADYFVIATGTSNTHVKSLADELEYEMSKLGIEPNHIEGKATGWILLDYGSVVIHVFTKEAREYYNLEKLWADGEEVDISSLISE